MIRTARIDPRYYQNAVLLGLLVYGITRLGFDITPLRALAIVTVALLTQLVCTRLARLETFDPKSALISGLSLCLLLRTHSVALALVAPVIAVAGKFVLRRRGKHLFNPTNGAIVALMLASDRVWVSPGQWGNAAWLAFLVACLGGVVVQRAARADVTLAFILAWGAVLLGRATWLGQSSAIPLHQIQNGAFLIFSFFMISDPRTTPDSRAGRIVFAVLVAAGAGFVQFVLYRTNGLLWSLAAMSLLVPVLDRLLPGVRHAWMPVQAHLDTLPKGAPHETVVPHPHPRARHGALGAGRA
jgi:Na+-transporting NADH:ubiquinone oxidoreductase subunit NqrB